MPTPRELIAQYATQAQQSAFFTDRMKIFNVQSYGAKGDGVTDDTDDIQDAIDAASTNGGIVFFPSGTYIISSTLEVGYPNITFMGSGMRNTIIQPDSGFTDTYLLDVDPTYHSSNLFVATFVMKDIGFDLDDQNIKGIHLASCRDGTVFERVYVNSFINTAIHIEISSKASASQPQGNSFYDVHCITDGAVPVGTAIWEIDDGNEPIFVACKGMATSISGSAGIGFRIGLTGQVNGGSMIDCSAAHMYGAGGIGTLFEKTSGFTVYNPKNENCATGMQFGSAETASLVNVYGLQIVDSTPIAVNFYDCTYCHVDVAVRIPTLADGYGAVNFDASADSCSLNARFKDFPSTNVTFVLGGTNNLCTGYYGKDFVTFSNNQGGIKFYDGTEFMVGANYATLNLDNTNNTFRIRSSTSNTLFTVNSTGEGLFAKGVNGGSFTDATKPLANSVSAGTMIWHSTKLTPLWSDGTQWRNSAGST